MFKARLEGANLFEAHLEGTDLRQAHLAGFELPPCDLRLAFLDSGTKLDHILLGTGQSGYVSVVDVRWGGANLAVVRWFTPEHDGWVERIKTIVLGDEREARQKLGRNGFRKDAGTRLNEFEAAARANQQLATVLRNQGSNNDANHFAYRSQVLQREILRRQGRVFAASGSWLLDLVSGHGYKPGRSYITYLLVILAFAAAFFTIGTGVLGIGGHDAINSPVSALVFSVTSFHGRGFFPGSGLPLDDPITILASVEAVIGLFIEIIFIATFTQRFFAR